MQNRLMLFVVICLFSCGSVFSAPVLWSSAVGGNDHWYEIVRDDYSDNHWVSWSEANDLANSMEYNGLKGHLATITSMAENEFLSSTSFLGASYGLYGDTLWLGGYQTPISHPEHFDPNQAGYDPKNEPWDNWNWVTGEEWNLTNWAGSEPNNGGLAWASPLHAEDYLAMSAGWFNKGYWFDVIENGKFSGNGAVSYIVEYEEMKHNPVPEPMTIVLSLISALGLIGFRKKN